MLELKKIVKEYKTEDYTQRALDRVSINFRENEFASILGPSGSGKTTLLNIIGGLDHYDSGELIINEVSTKKYKDRDWDSYRNHRIGFVFQSYNLIFHQSVLSNVELALTLSGVSKSERRKKAIDALKKVGLGKHIHKRPSQLSGGQMQRVAIARALVNDPDILLADEPTGALDSETSVQIMKIIKKISQDKLVIMVTHNPDLALEYSTRIIKLKDGKIIDDSNPYDGKVNTKDSLENEKKKSKKTSMNLKTALSLSLNNLMTKKGRTVLTAFAGSIGIIGIALIMSLSNGVNKYISDVQKDAMVSYPISIEEETVDLSSMIKSNPKDSNDKKSSHKKDAVYSDSSGLLRYQEVKTSVSKNNLTLFKKYLESKENEINKYVGSNGITYSYDTKFSVYTNDADGRIINTDGSTFDAKVSNEAYSNMMDGVSFSVSAKSPFSLLMAGSDVISPALKEEYEVVSGDWPKKYDEVVLVVDKNNEVSISDLYNLGLLPASSYEEILDKLNNGEKVNIESFKLKYDDIISKKFKLLTASDFYVKSGDFYKNISDDDGKVEELLNSALELKISGVIRQRKDSKTELISTPIGYTKLLTDWIINHTLESDVVKQQKENSDINVLNGLKFTVSSDEEKASEAKKYLKSLSVSEKAKLSTSILKKAYGGDALDKMLSLGETELAYMLDQYLLNPDEKVLISIYDDYISSGSLDDNLKEFGVVSLDSPSSINIYVDSFEDKDSVVSAIDKYNKKAKDKDKIVYTDYVGLLMSSVTTIVNAISYVLIAFVSISLIVSSIMIAIITYISVLERTKEIGILRAIGASKKDITRVFNAETFIEGFIAGVFGIVITLILNIPINIIIEGITDISGISKLPVVAAIILIIISVILTVIAGVIPSKMAAKKDPVEALRSE